MHGHLNVKFTAQILNTTADYWILVSAGESWDENTSFLT